MKKHLLLILSALFVAATMFAVPAKRNWQTKTTPDGTTISVRQVGDEFYHFWETTDGKIAKRQSDGTFVVTDETRPSAEQIKKRRINSPLYQTSAARKAVGTLPNLAPKGVVILANFKDVKMDPTHTKAVFDELCNSTNCTVNKWNGKDYGSAAQYFSDQSNGSYRPQFDIYGPVTLSEKMAYYGKDTDPNDEGSDAYAANAVMEACILANQQYSDLNFADYDSDSDGKVDFVYMIYAGTEQAETGVTDEIWPHNWEMEAAVYYGNCTYSSDQRKLDGKAVNNYACSGELSGSALCGIGTLCHEFGHVMGLPDLYDTDYGSNYDNYKTPGDWNVMDGGSYGGDGHCPPNYDPWQKYFFGWITPVNLGTEGQNITLQANGSDGYVAYQINSSNKLQTPTTTGVVYYLENRQKSGWDTDLPGSGMLVWKINFKSAAWQDNAPNNTSTSGSPLHTVISADGGTQIGNIYVDGELTRNGNRDPFPGATNTREYTPISGHALTAISMSNGLVTFKYNGGVQKTEYAYTVDVDNATTTSESGSGATGTALSLTVTPATGYTLADASCWVVEMGLLNELVYGTDFTYNPATNEFRIENVTDDVTILAEGKKSFEVAWFANGTSFTTTTSAGSLVLPATTPADCDDKLFVGWCADASYESPDVAPTFAQDGDAVTEGAKFYAVYAEVDGAGTSSVEKATAITEGDSVILVCESKGFELSEFSTTSTVYGIGTAYSGNPAGIYAFKVVEGSESGSFAFERDEIYWNWKSGNSMNTATSVAKKSSWFVSFEGDDAVIKNADDNTRVIQWNATSPRFACYTTKQTAVQLYKKTAGASYSNYATSCGGVTPTCVLNGIELNTEDVKKDFLTTDEFTTAGLVVTALFDGESCDEMDVTEQATIAAPTLTAGTQTVTVVYENKSASYDIKVTAPVTHVVKYFACGDEYVSQTYADGEMLVLPQNPAGNDGKAFYGWIATEHYTGASAPTLITAGSAVTEDANYYAVYK